MYKANFDVALFDGLGMAGLGVIVRDYMRHIIAPLVKRLESLILWRWLKLWPTTEP